MTKPPLSVLGPTAIVLALLGAGQATAQVNQQAIQDVAAGTLKVARASWWGFDATEATQCLQAAISSKVPKLIVDNVGRPWIVDPINLVSNQEVIFEAGVEVVAKKGSFQGGNDSLFTGRLVENVYLHGDLAAPAVLRMHRSDYAKPPYAKAEWRMVLNLLSCRQVRVEDLILRESGGDGIYLGVGEKSLPCKNVVIRRVVCDRNYRQGISVICAEDLLIEDCKLISTGGTAPMAGIDFEPNGPTERLVRCTMRNCVTQGNSGCGYAIYIPTLDATSLPVSLRFENCRSIRDGGYGAAIYTGNTPEMAVKGSIEFINCAFERSRNAGIVVGGKPVNGARMVFDHCRVRNVATRQPAETPIILMAYQGAGQPIGGIEFRDCLVRDLVSRNPMGFVDQSGFASLAGITGRLTVQSQGRTTEHRLTPRLLDQWMPVARLAKVPQVSLPGLALQPVAPAVAATDYGMPGVRVRARADFIVHAAEGQEVRVRVGFQPVAYYSGTTMPVTVTGPSGQQIVETAGPFGGEMDVVFTAPETGLHRLVAQPGSNYVHVVKSSHPVNLALDTAPPDLYGQPGPLYFWVPEGAREFAALVYGESSGEAVKATLLDARGQVVQEQDNITKIHQFLVSLPEPSPGEAWSIVLAPPSVGVMEDSHLMLWGLPPLVASSREALLRPVK